jgi:hypothetical protein
MPTSARTANAVRYTVREGAGGQVRIQKWRQGQGKVGTYWVEAQEWWQRCTCPARVACKHVRLVNLIDSGRLGPGPYVWDGKTWEVAGLDVTASAPALADNIRSGGSNRVNIQY